MVLGQPIHVVIERVQAGGGDDSRLPERATEHLLPPPRLVDQLARPRQHRTHRRSQALREVDPRGVEPASKVRSQSPERHDRVHQPRPVHVRAQAVRAGNLQDRLNSRQRPDATPTEVRSLLDRHDSRARHVPVARRPQRRLELGGREHPAVAVEHPDHQSGDDSRSAGLRIDRMCGPVQQQLIAAGTGVKSQRDLVAHRPARKEDRSRKTQQLGHPILQTQGGRIEPSLFVAYGRAGDGLAHPGSRSRLRSLRD